MQRRLSVHRQIAMERAINGSVGLAPIFLPYVQSRLCDQLAAPFAVSFFAAFLGFFSQPQGPCSTAALVATIR
jgi:hypothetical protein